ncbi:hypothetical protein [Enterococcus faecalis]|uniref:hypothetical protein n=1 Tax=Enterococcus faecalis TaxID=1351 RepID=UPI0018A99C13|nr:hypothetical protein [Enterococcus faecalis]
MNSVIFEDIARIQAEKKQKRKEMLKLMNENPDWYRHPKSMVYRQIKMLGKSRIEDGGELGAEEAFNQLENLEENGEVLLIDGSLL